MQLRLHEILRSELQGKNISQIAKQIGVSKSLLHDWTNSRRSPNAKNFPALLKLAKYLGLTLEALLFGESTTDKTVLASTTFADGSNQYRVQIEKMKK